MATETAAARRLDRAAFHERRLAAMAGARAAGYGPQTSRALRKTMSIWLRVAGCTYQQIGDLFGVTGEAIRIQIIKPPRP